MCRTKKLDHVDHEEKRKTARKKKKCCSRCCNACLKRICRCINRRIKRCVKKKIFGVPDPKLHEYEVAGINLERIKDKMLPSKTHSLTSLVKQNRKKSKLYIPDVDLIKGMNAKELEKKFSVSPSKAKVLSKLVDDYKKGRVSVSAMPDSRPSKFKWFKSRKRKLDKERINKLIDGYDEITNKSKTRSSKIIEKLRGMDPLELKKKFSLSSARHKDLEHMIDDYRNRKVSLSKLSNKSKFSLSSMSKGQVNQLLLDYKAQKKSTTKLPFSWSLGSLVDKLKSTRFSISSATKNIFKK